MSTAPKTMDANAVYKSYSVTRGWLRQKYAEGRLRRTETHGLNQEGKEYIKFLYSVEDIERLLAEEGRLTASSADPDPFARAGETSPLTSLTDAMAAALESSCIGEAELASILGMTLLTLNRRFADPEGISVALFDRWIAACGFGYEVTLRRRSPSREPPREPREPRAPTVQEY
jgi:hypothetical protein